ncbi:MAG TPA: GNAT family N-acetyltransferase [Gaiellaceae bacterium]|nr:GNAT family N-acetyltransferase [Gaiellaceae bacterium]
MRATRGCARSRSRRPRFLRTLAEEQDLGEDEWRERVRPDGRRAWFAEEEGDRFAGIVVVAFAEPDPELASLFSMWVDPARRRRGTGRSLIEAAVEWAAERGARQVELEVNEEMRAAKFLYASCGFSPTGRQRELPSASGGTGVQMMRGVDD